MAYPGRVFDGKITTIGRRRSDDSSRAGALRNRGPAARTALRHVCDLFIRPRPVRSLAIPLDGVVREGDGTMTVWVTADRRRFTRRTVRIGLQHNGYGQFWKAWSRASWSQPKAPCS